MNRTLLKPCVAELIGTFTLVFIGGSARYSAGTGGGVGLPGGAVAGLVYGRFLIKEKD